MKISEIRETLKLTDAIACKSDNEVQGVYIGDLLSLVMAKAKPADLWLTIQTHINIIAVADLIEISGIVILEDMAIDEDTLQKAVEIGIPIFRTKLSAYEMACQLHDLGL
ncbi:MAG: hypothetical protein JXQ26_07595 [Tissierellales bacterium]|jgi:hypothetical protein|nr:hypothetical protein [Tissierellales bacterium]MBN2827837.1 hypothetical protein [Tissierellales bacterium]